MRVYNLLDPEGSTKAPLYPGLQAGQSEGKAQHTNFQKDHGDVQKKM